MRLWLNHETYVELDEQGYCRQHPLEGAMGFIIQAVRLNASGQTRIAWKIPRLVADTHRENTHVEQALATEYRHVREVEQHDKNKTLIGTMLANPFGRPIPGITDDGATYPPDGTYWLLVAFDKDKPPRFCCVPVRVDEEQGLYVVADDRVEPFVDAARPISLKKLNIARRKDQPHPAPSMVTCRTEEGGQHATKAGLSPSQQGIIGLVDTINPSTEPPPWYLGISSVCYEWASGTLQEAMDRGLRKEWHPEQHYELLRRLLTGVKILHDCDRIHGDLRPANVMYRRAPEDPENYCITDYGSFATGPGAAIPGEARPTDRTQLEAISAVRVSPYYSPERRAGREDENADAALFLRAPDRLFLIVGWRTHFREVAQEPNWLDALLGGEISQAPSSFAVQGETSTDPVPGVPTQAQQSVHLQQGDRLRLRDFVFDIESVAHRNKFRVYTATEPAWLVVHERLLVPAGKDDIEYKTIGEVEGPAVEAHLVSLSRVIELPMWTSASDIYAIGVIALRSCFPSRDEVRATDQKPANHVERGFLNLLEVLANPLYAQVIWDSLDFVCRHIEQAAEEALEKGASAEAVPTTNMGKVKLPFTPKLSHGSRSPSLQDLAEEIALDITSTAPQADRLLTVTFESNTAFFLLFIHFVLSCLHRSSSFERKDKESTRPFFAESRRDSGSRATDKALERVKLLKELCRPKNVVLKNMKCTRPVTHYDPRSSAELTLDNQKLRGRLKDLARDFRELTDERKTLQETHDTLERRHGMLEAASLNQRRNYNKNIDDLRGQLVEARRHLGACRDTFAVFQRRVLAIRDEILALGPEIEGVKDGAERLRRVVISKDQVEQARARAVRLERAYDKALKLFDGIDVPADWGGDRG